VELLKSFKEKSELFSAKVPASTKAEIRIFSLSRPAKSSEDPKAIEEIIEISPPLGFPSMYFAPRELKSKPLTEDVPPSKYLLKNGNSLLPIPVP